ncbi:MAG: LacI family DNA-binding transcriptional regulator [Treponema sp.]|nr:LacI family DNA-binding transcriptional regulator [Treponema sp.]
MTIREIAELAGVSIGTVDRVIYRRGRVSAETRDKIEGIIEKYQFTPNPIARRLKRNRAYRFYALIPRRYQDSAYWEQALQGLEWGADGVRPLGVETEVLEYDRYNPGEARNAVNHALAQEPDGMIFAPIVAIKRFIPLVRERGIPYVFFDSDFPEMEPLCTISQDPIRGGYLAGRLMHLFAGKITRPVAVLDAHSEDYHIIRRRDGFLQYAEEYGFATVVKEYSGGGELSEGEITLLFRENPGLDGIFVTNSLAHLVAQTVKNIRKTRDVVIIGYDLIPNNRELLQAGAIDALISQRSVNQGREAVLNLYRHVVLDEKIEPKVEIPLDIYVKENIPPIVPGTGRR